MLDQNTDRMWYVIGAVLVGAAIIFIANGTLPDIFASIARTYEETTSDTIDNIEWHSTNLMVPYGITNGSMLREDDGKFSSEGYGPHHAVSDYMRVEPNVSYTVMVPGNEHTTVIVYYDAEYNFLDSEKKYKLSEYSYVAHPEAKYARVSNRILGEGSVPVSKWWFGKTTDKPTYK